MPLTLSAARMLRNGGIDACAALNSALLAMKYLRESQPKTL